jgi:hypothetical protein
MPPRSSCAANSSLLPVIRLRSIRNTLVTQRKHIQGFKSRSNITPDFEETDEQTTILGTTLTVRGSDGPRGTER